MRRLSRLSNLRHGAAELGRQPWIVYRMLRVDEAVTAARGLPIGLFTLLAVYIVLTIATVFVVRRTLAPGEPGPRP